MTTRRNPTSTSSEGRGWAEYVQAHLDSLGWSNTILATRADIDRSLIGRWLNEGTQPSVESVRATARAIGRPVLEGLVAAGILTEDELKQPLASDDPDLRIATDEKLLDEVRRRMQRGRPHSAPGRATYTEVEEQSGVDVGETQEEPSPIRRRSRGSTARRARASS